MAYPWYITVSIVYVAKIYHNCSKNGRAKELTLYLVWDSESETDKDCTLLESNFTARDSSSDSDAPRKRHKKRKKSKKSTSSSEKSESSESSEDWDSL